MIYMVAMIYKPNKEEEKNGKVEDLILSPVAFLAKDEKTAGMKAVIQHSDLIKAYGLDEVEVVVRSF